MKTLLTGATGFVGKQLIEQLANPVILSRNAADAKERFSGHQLEAYDWNPQKGPPPAKVFDGVEVVINLAGEPVADGRWNRAKKQRILDSRATTTRHLVDGIRALDEDKRPAVLVSASAVGYYGLNCPTPLDESSPVGDDFLSLVCERWEEEAMKAEDLGVRVACVRIGIVLGRGGGAMSKMLLPFKLGLGGNLGNGKQWMPWVHLNDVVGILKHAATNDAVRGPINAVSPNCVTNREFTKTLGRVLHRPTILPAPGLALRLGIGQFAEIMLVSQQVQPTVAESTGYKFAYPDLDGAFEEIVHDP